MDTMMPVMSGQGMKEICYVMQVPSPAPCYTISAFVRHDS